jgi:hypothetical protein
MTYLFTERLSQFLDVFTQSNTKDMRIHIQGKADGSWAAVQVPMPITAEGKFWDPVYFTAEIEGCLEEKDGDFRFAVVLNDLLKIHQAISDSEVLGLKYENPKCSLYLADSPEELDGMEKCTVAVAASPCPDVRYQLPEHSATYDGLRYGEDGWIEFQAPHDKYDQLWVIHQLPEEGKGDIESLLGLMRACGVEHEDKGTYMKARRMRRKKRKEEVEEHPRAEQTKVADPVELEEPQPEENPDPEDPLLNASAGQVAQVAEESKNKAEDVEEEEQEEAPADSTFVPAGSSVSKKSEDIPQEEINEMCDLAWAQQQLEDADYLLIPPPEEMEKLGVSDLLELHRTVAALLTDITETISEKPGKSADLDIDDVIDHIQKLKEQK